MCEQTIGPNPRPAGVSGCSASVVPPEAARPMRGFLWPWIGHWRRWATKYRRIQYHG